MKRSFLILFALALLLVSCAGEGSGTGSGQIIGSVTEKEEMLRACIPEMEAFLLERVYVALEVPKDSPPGTEKRLVQYEKESGERKVIHAPALEEVLREFDLSLIFYQTAENARRSVIFSYGKENDPGIVRGFYYSYDDLPSAWWGRKGALEKDGNRFVQGNKNGGGEYFTVKICPNFYYFEKRGNLVA